MAKKQPKLEELLTEIPKGVFCRLAGRQQKVIDEMGHRYGWPVTSAKVNLFLAISKILDSFVERRSASSHSLVGVSEQTAKAKLRRVRRQNELLEEKLKELRLRLVPVEHVHEMLAWLQSELKRFGEVLGQENSVLQAAFNEFLTSLAKEVEARKTNC